MNAAHQQAGMTAASGAFLLWGLLPIYWKSLSDVPSFEILGHRMAWSLPFTIVFLLIFRHRAFSAQLKNKTVLESAIIGSLLLAGNWFVYIWAVNSGYIVEASLGYYINPLVSVALGVIFMRERLRSGQIAAIGIAAGGVMYLTFVYGTFPWIALALALSFGLYGLLHKKIRIGPLESLHFETLIFFIPAVGFLLYLEISGRGAFLHASSMTTLVLIGTGLVTTVPLLLFAYAAQNIPLSLLGILQYIAPTISLLIGIFLYGEAFPLSRLVGFMLVWSGLLIYVIEGAGQRARQRRMSCRRGA